MLWSLRLSDRLFLVSLLEYIEGHLFVTLIGNKSLSVEFILNAGQHSVRRTKIHQYPGAHSSKLRNAIEHGQLMAVNIRLIFLCPPLVVVSVQAGLRVSPKFTYD